MDHAGKVEIDEEANSRVFLAISTPFKMSEDVLPPVNERFYFNLVLHGVLKRLLQNEIEDVPVHSLVLVEHLKVDIGHFIDLFTGPRALIHHVVICLSLLPLVILLFIVSQQCHKSCSAFFSSSGVLLMELSDRVHSERHGSLSSLHRAKEEGLHDLLLLNQSFCG